MTPVEVVPVLLSAGIVAGVAAGGRPWRPRSLRPAVPAEPASSSPSSPSSPSSSPAVEALVPVRSGGAR